MPPAFAEVAWLFVWFLAAWSPSLGTGYLSLWPVFLYERPDCFSGRVGAPGSSVVSAFTCRKHLTARPARPSRRDLEQRLFAGMPEPSSLSLRLSSRIPSTRWS